MNTVQQSLFARAVDNFEETLIAVLLGLMTLITFANVVARYVFNSNILWGIEVTVYLFAWLVLMGASYGVKKHIHIGVDVIINLASPRWRYLLALLSACAPAAKRVDGQAARLGLSREQVRGAGFTLRLYANHIRGGDLLHAYIGGDGRPWRRIDQISTDPDTPHALLLDLLALDSRPALFLGRPCYHGLAQTPACSAWFWTMGRYSERVVEALRQALRKRLHRYVQWCE